MLAFAEGECIVSFALVRVDALPVAVAALADMASASASAPAKVDAVNVLMDLLLSQVGDARSDDRAFVASDSLAARVPCRLRGAHRSAHLLHERANRGENPQKGPLARAIFPRASEIRRSRGRPWIGEARSGAWIGEARSDAWIGEARSDAWIGDIERCGE
jgi:hypothetical protein